VDKIAIGLEASISHDHGAGAYLLATAVEIHYLNPSDLASLHYEIDRTRAAAEHSTMFDERRVHPAEEAVRAATLPVVGLGTLLPASGRLRLNLIPPELRNVRSVAWCEYATFGIKQIEGAPDVL
jgi:hypothetical protein